MGALRPFLLTIQETDMTVNFIPDGMHAVTAHLVCAGAADAIEFYKKVLSRY